MRLVPRNDAAPVTATTRAREREGRGARSPTLASGPGASAARRIFAGVERATSSLFTGDDIGPAKLQKAGAAGTSLVPARSSWASARLSPLRWQCRDAPDASRCAHVGGMPRATGAEPRIGYAARPARWAPPPSRRRCDSARTSCSGASRRAGWRRCISRAAEGRTASRRSSRSSASCRSSRATPTSSRCSSTRRGSARASATRTSSRCSTSASRTASSTWRWSTSTARPARASFAPPRRRDEEIPLDVCLHIALSILRGARVRAQRARRGRAPAVARAPRRVARQRAHRSLGRGEAHRLRHRARERDRAADRRGAAQRQARVHVAGAGRGARARRAERSVHPRDRARRDGHPPPALHRRERARRPHAHPRRRPHRARSQRVARARRRARRPLPRPREGPAPALPDRRAPSPRRSRRSSAAAASRSGPRSSRPASRSSGSSDGDSTSRRTPTSAISTAVLDLAGELRPIAMSEPSAEPAVRSATCRRTSTGCSSPTGRSSGRCRIRASSSSSRPGG